ncbi:MAG: hypothetical protein EG822_16390 [Deltaproteobacteria bacterium]|nr:hypothetical protein [Deltaproteobacteria bacterium]
MKHLPHVLGVLFLTLSMLWIVDNLDDFAVAHRISDTRYVITAAGWETVYGVWPVVAAAAVISGGITFFAGLVLGENWVTKDFRKQVTVLMQILEAERIMLKSKSISILNRREEMERELIAEKHKMRRLIQKLKGREKELEEREKNLATLEKKLAVMKTKKEKEGFVRD